MGMITLICTKMDKQQDLRSINHNPPRPLMEGIKAAVGAAMKEVSCKFLVIALLLSITGRDRYSASLR